MTRFNPIRSLGGHIELGHSYTTMEYVDSNLEQMRAAYDKLWETEGKELEDAENLG